MKKRYIALAALGAAAVATGFPKRIGATRAVAAVSLPGDLLIPQAAVVVDRCLTVTGTNDDVWPLIAEFMRGESGTLTTEMPGEAYVLSAPEQQLLTGAVVPQSTVTIALLPAVDGHVQLHYRRRYDAQDTGQKAAAWAHAVADIPRVMMCLLAIKAQGAQIAAEVELAEF